MGGGWLEFIAIRRVYMGLWEEGSRGRGISAIGGWQWGRGFCPRVYGGPAIRGNNGGRDGSPHARGHGEGGMGWRMRETFA